VKTFHQLRPFRETVMESGASPKGGAAKTAAALPTIKDVAREAGVSVGTVSRVLNSHKTVSPEIKSRVENAIAALNYAPNSFAQGMRSGAKRSVGIILRDITVPALATFVKSAQNVFQEAGYTLVVGASEDRPKREVELLESLSRRLDGLIMTSACEENPHLTDLRNAVNIPIVLMDREAPPHIDSVLIAQRDGMHRAVSYLLDLGHKRIALVTGSTTVLSGRERVAGYIEAHRERGLTPASELICCSSFTADYAYMAVSSLLLGANRPTAVVAGGVAMLPGILRAVSTEGLRIPQDISVIGCGDSDLAELMNPPITVIRWSYSAVGEASAKLILDRIQNPETPRRQLRFPTELAIRRSCAAPP
jgi:LacI family transcriptional regulator